MNILPVLIATGRVHYSPLVGYHKSNEKKTGTGIEITKYGNLVYNLESENKDRNCQMFLFWMLPRNKNQF